MLHLAVLERFEGHLRTVSGIIDAHEAHDPRAVDKITDWLRELGGMLRDHRQPGEGRVASWRGAIAAARRASDIPRAQRRRHAEAEALRVLRAAVDWLEERLDPDRERLRRGQAAALELSVHGLTRGLHPNGSAGTTREAVVRAFWSQVLAEADLRPAATALLAAVGPGDTIALIDRALSRA